MIEWKPIKTAPKDGTAILAVNKNDTTGNGSFRIVFWHELDKCWADFWGDNETEKWSSEAGGWGLTHWAKLELPE